MKLLVLFISLFSFTAFADDVPRNLKANPLTRNEKVALDASRSLAKALGNEVRRECVNANDPGNNRFVSVQFYYYDEEEGAECGDEHYSISVEFDAEGNIVSFSLRNA